MSEDANPSNNRVFATGAQRDNADGKGRFDLIPWDAMLVIARHFETGAKKYGPGNWTKGMPMSVFADSALRHVAKHMAGWDDEDHLAAAAWNLICMIATRERIKAGALPAGLAVAPDAPSVTIDQEPAEKVIEELRGEKVLQFLKVPKE